VVPADAGNGLAHQRAVLVVRAAPSVRPETYNQAIRLPKRVGGGAIGSLKASNEPQPHRIAAPIRRSANRLCPHPFRSRNSEWLA